MSIHIEQLKISTAEVEIKIATVSGRRMTKAVFNQVLPAPFWRIEKAPTKGELTLKPVSDLLGYIHAGGHWLLFQEGQHLRKCRIYKVYKSDHTGYYDLKQAVGNFDDFASNNLLNKAALFIPVTSVITNFIKTAQEEQLFISI